VPRICSFLVHAYIPAERVTAFLMTQTGDVKVTTLTDPWGLYLDPSETDNMRNEYAMN
jgi:hypothetical protein